MVEIEAGSTETDWRMRHTLSPAARSYRFDHEKWRLALANGGVMFEDLYDRISIFWSRRWPVADGIVTEVISERLGRDRDRARLAVAYEFSVGGDGPYTGECFWTPAFFPLRRVSYARKRLRKSKRVRVRYRPDDPSVNTLDGGLVRLLKTPAMQE